MYTPEGHLKTFINFVLTFEFKIKAKLSHKRIYDEYNCPLDINDFFV